MISILQTLASIKLVIEIMESPMSKMPPKKKVLIAENDPKMAFVYRRCSEEMEKASNSSIEVVDLGNVEYALKQESYDVIILGWTGEYTIQVLAFAKKQDPEPYVIVTTNGELVGVIEECSLSRNTVYPDRVSQDPIEWTKIAGMINAAPKVLGVPEVSLTIIMWKGAFMTLFALGVLVLAVIQHFVHSHAWKVGMWIVMAVLALCTVFVLTRKESVEDEDDYTGASAVKQNQ